MRGPGISRLAFAALGFVAVGALALAALHALVPIDPRARYLSDYYDSGSSRWLIESAYVAMGVAGLLVALALRLHAGGRGRLAVGAALIAASAAGVVALAIWPAGVVHVTLIWGGQAVFLAGAALVGAGARGRPRWKGVAYLSWTLVLFAALGVARLDHWMPWPGLFQRIYLIVTLSWLAFVALALASG